MGIYQDPHTNECKLCREAIDRFIHFKNEINSELDKIRKIIMACDNIIQGHAIGVQNVYNEILEMKRIYQITNVDKELFDKIEKIKRLELTLNEILD